MRIGFRKRKENENSLLYNKIIFSDTQQQVLFSFPLFPLPQNRALRKEILV